MVNVPLHIHLWNLESFHLSLLPSQNSGSASLTAVNGCLSSIQLARTRQCPISKRNDIVSTYVSFLCIFFIRKKISTNFSTGFNTRVFHQAQNIYTGSHAEKIEFSFFAQEGKFSSFAHLSSPMFPELNVPGSHEQGDWCEESKTCHLCCF